MKLKKELSNRKLNKVSDEINSKGFSIIKLFSKNDIDNFFKEKIIKNLNSRNLINYKFNKKNISNYHNIVKDENIHKKLIDPAKRQVDLEHIIKKLNKNSKINNLVKDQWGEKQYEVRLYFKNKIKKNFAAFRLARPFKKFKDDVGGAHLDLHFNNKIYSNHNILFTIWIPIIGFNKNYTLRLSPHSHKKKHKIENMEKQKKYISKVYKKSYLKNFKFKRFNMNKGEVIIFHPNLLHGYSKNNGNFTRASLDLRIYNTKLI